MTEFHRPTTNQYIVSKPNTMTEFQQTMFPLPARRSGPLPRAAAQTRWQDFECSPLALRFGKVADVNGMGEGGSVTGQDEALCENGVRGWIPSW